MKKIAITLTAICIMVIMMIALKNAIGKDTFQRATDETTNQLVMETEEETTEENTTKEETTEEILITEENTTQKESETRKEVTGGSGATLSFVGDFYLSPAMYANYQANGISGIISEKIQSIFNEVDIAAADHEYVCADLTDADKVTYQQYTFLTPTEREYILKDFSFDVMTLANNHMMDYKEAGLLSTMSMIQNQGIATIGGGANLAEAMKPYTATVNGKKIAILAATRVVPQTDWYATDSKAGLATTYESTERFQMIKDEITRLKTEENYDCVIMYVHWGNDSQADILDSQVQLGHGYIDAGADMVVGNHTHVLQGMEIYNGKTICYGISNFLFGSYRSDTMVLTLNINEDNSITSTVIPCVSANYYTKELEGEERTQMFRYIESMSTNVKITEDGIIQEK